MEQMFIGLTILVIIFIAIIIGAIWGLVSALLLIRKVIDIKPFDLTPAKIRYSNDCLKYEKANQKI